MEYDYACFVLCVVRVLYAVLLCVMCAACVCVCCMYSYLFTYPTGRKYLLVIYFATSLFYKPIKFKHIISYSFDLGMQLLLVIKYQSVLNLRHQVYFQGGRSKLNSAISNSSRVEQLQ